MKFCCSSCMCSPLWSGFILLQWYIKNMKFCFWPQFFYIKQNLCSHLYFCKIPLPGQNIWHHLLKIFISMYFKMVCHNEKKTWSWCRGIFGYTWPADVTEISFTEIISLNTKQNMSVCFMMSVFKSHNRKDPIRKLQW